MELGRRGKNSRAVRRALEGVIEHPLPVEDAELDGVDVALAIRALGELGATASAKTLVRLFRADAPEAGVAATAPTRERHGRPYRYLIPALGGLRCRTARHFLQDYVRRSPEEAARVGPPQFEEATHALLQQRLDWAAIANLLRSPNPAVRGAALLECLDRPNEERRLALRKAASWAFELPGARAVLPPVTAR
jgi:HEAT repeat protein